MGNEKLMKGMDLSVLAEVEACGGRFFDHGVQRDAMEILADYGMNMVRLRLWNDPYDENGRSYGAGTCDLPCVMELARRAKRLGIAWMLDLHYSDFWADPQKQVLPKGWAGKSAEEVERAVFDFTFSVLTVLKEAGLLPAVVAVGNEVTNGLLWPFGKVAVPGKGFVSEKSFMPGKNFVPGKGFDSGKASDFGQMVRFLNAGIDAVKAVDEGISVMIHLDNGGDNVLYRSWFDAYFAAGGKDFTYIGLSYYPFWSGTMEELFRNMDDLAGRYRKDLIIAEVSAGFTLEDYREFEGLSDEQRKGMAARAEVTKHVPYPMTPKGQGQFMKDLIEMLHRVRDGRGKGFVYWGPEWIPVPGSEWARESAIAYMKEKGPGGNEWANQALFDYHGNVLPALEVIRDAGCIGDKMKKEDLEQ